MSFCTDSLVESLKCALCCCSQLLLTLIVIMLGVEGPLPQTRAHMMQTHLNTDCWDQTVWIRPSWANCCKETVTEEYQEEEENDFKQKHKGWTIDEWEAELRFVESSFEIFGLVLCEIRRIWYLCVWSPREARRKGVCLDALPLTLLAIYLKYKAR